MRWKLEQTLVEKSVKAFIDLIILCRLSNVPISGYEITNRLVKETGIFVSPGMVYHTLYLLEINGLIKCVRKKPGRAYVLTEKGIEQVDKTSEIKKDLQALLGLLLTKNSQPVKIQNQRYL